MASRHKPDVLNGSYHPKSSSNNIILSDNDDTTSKPTQIQLDPEEPTLRRPVITSPEESYNSHDDSHLLDRLPNTIETSPLSIKRSRSDNIGASPSLTSQSHPSFSAHSTLCMNNKSVLQSNIPIKDLNNTLYSLSSHQNGHNKIDENVLTHAVSHIVNPSPSPSPADTDHTIEETKDGIMHSNTTTSRVQYHRTPIHPKLMPISLRPSVVVTSSDIRNNNNNNNQISSIPVDNTDILSNLRVCHSNRCNNPAITTLSSPTQLDDISLSSVSHHGGGGGGDCGGIDSSGTHNSVSLSPDPHLHSQGFVFHGATTSSTSPSIQPNNNNHNSDKNPGFRAALSSAFPIPPILSSNEHIHDLSSDLLLSASGIPSILLDYPLIVSSTEPPSLLHVCSTIAMHLWYAHPPLFSSTTKTASSSSSSSSSQEGKVQSTSSHPSHVSPSSPPKPLPSYYTPLSHLALYFILYAYHAYPCTAIQTTIISLSIFVLSLGFFFGWHIPIFLCITLFCIILIILSSLRDTIQLIQANDTFHTTQMALLSYIRSYFTRSRLSTSLLDISSLNLNGGSVSDIVSLLLFNMRPEHRARILHRLPISFQRILTTTLYDILPTFFVDKVLQQPVLVQHQQHQQQQHHHDNNSNNNPLASSGAIITTNTGTNKNPFITPVKHTHDHDGGSTVTTHIHNHQPSFNHDDTLITGTEPEDLLWSTLHQSTTNKKGKQSSSSSSLANNTPLRPLSAGQFITPFRRRMRSILTAPAKRGPLFDPTKPFIFGVMSYGLDHLGDSIIHFIKEEHPDKYKIYKNIQYNMKHNPFTRFILRLIGWNDLVGIKNNAGDDSDSSDDDDDNDDDDNDDDDGDDDNDVDNHRHRYITSQPSSSSSSSAYPYNLSMTYPIDDITPEKQPQQDNTYNNTTTISTLNDDNDTKSTISCNSHHNNNINIINQHKYIPYLSDTLLACSQFGIVVGISNNIHNNTTNSHISNMVTFPSSSLSSSSSSSSSHHIPSIYDPSTCTLCGCYSDPSILSDPTHNDHSNQDDNSTRILHSMKQPPRHPVLIDTSTIIYDPKYTNISLSGPINDNNDNTSIKGQSQNCQLHDSRNKNRKESMMMKFNNYDTHHHHILSLLLPPSSYQYIHYESLPTSSLSLLLGDIVTSLHTTEMVLNTSSNVSQSILSSKLHNHMGLPRLLTSSSLPLSSSSLLSHDDHFLTTTTDNTNLGIRHQSTSDNADTDTLHIPSHNQIQTTPPQQQYTQPSLLCSSCLAPPFLKILNILASSSTSPLNYTISSTSSSSPSSLSVSLTSTPISSPSTSLSYIGHNSEHTHSSTSTLPLFPTPSEASLAATTTLVQQLTTLPTSPCLHDTPPSSPQQQQQQYTSDMIASHPYHHHSHISSSQQSQSESQLQSVHFQPHPLLLSTKSLTKQHKRSSKSRRNIRLSTQSSSSSSPLSSRPSFSSMVFSFLRIFGTVAISLNLAQRLLSRRMQSELTRTVIHSVDWALSIFTTLSISHSVLVRQQLEAASLSSSSPSSSLISGLEHPAVRSKRLHGGHVRTSSSSPWLTPNKNTHSIDRQQHHHHHHSPLRVLAQSSFRGFRETSVYPTENNTNITGPSHHDHTKNHHNYSHHHSSINQRVPHYAQNNLTQTQKSLHMPDCLHTRQYSLLMNSIVSGPPSSSLPDGDINDMESGTTPPSTPRNDDTTTTTTTTNSPVNPELQCSRCHGIITRQEMITLLYLTTLLQLYPPEMLSSQLSCVLSSYDNHSTIINNNDDNDTCHGLSSHHHQRNQNIPARSTLTALGDFFRSVISTISPLSILRTFGSSISTSARHADIVTLLFLSLWIARHAIFRSRINKILTNIANNNR